MNGNQEIEIYLNLREHPDEVLLGVAEHDATGNAATEAARILLGNWLSVPAPDRDTDEMIGDIKIVIRLLEDWGDLAVSKTKQEAKV